MSGVHEKFENFFSLYIHIVSFSALSHMYIILVILIIYVHMSYNMSLNEVGDLAINDPQLFLFFAFPTVCANGNQGGSLWGCTSTEVQYQSATSIV